MTGRLARLAGLPARRPWTVLGISLLCAFAAIFAIWRSHADASMRSMFPSGDPASAAMVQVLNHFRAADDLLVLVTLKDSQPTDAALLLQFADRLKAEIHGSPAAKLVEAVVYRLDDDSKHFFERVLVPAGMYYLSDHAYAAARERLTTTEISSQIHRNEAMISAPGPAAGALSSTLLQDPLRLHEFLTADLASRLPMKFSGSSGAFLSADGRSLLIRIVGKNSLDDLDYAREVTTSITTLCGKANIDALRIDISGGYAIATASERAIRHDMIVSVISSVLFLQALFIVAYRRPIRYFLLAFIPVAFGILIGFGIRALLGTAISPAAAVVGAVLGGLGIDYTVLYLPHYLAARHGGANTVAATSRTTRLLALTLFAACVTSIIGFVAIGWSSVPAMRDLSLVGALSLAGALLASMIVLPSLLAVMSRTAMAGGPRVSLSPLLAGIAARRRVWIGAMLVILCGSFAVIALTPGKIFPLESDLTVMHPRPNAPLDAQAFIARRMGMDPSSMLVYIKASSPEELVSRAYAVSNRLSTPAARQAGISGVFGVASLLPDPSVVKRRRDALSSSQVDQIVSDFHRAIQESSFNESAYVQYEAFLRRLLLHPTPPGIADLVPYSRLAETILSREELSARASPKSWQAISVIFFDRPMDDRTARGTAIQTVRNLLADVHGATLTGLGVVGWDVEHTIARDLPKLMTIACSLVVIYLVIHFRNLYMAALATVPAVFSIACLLAFMRLTGQTFNLVNLISLPLLIGIDVDYGVFIVSLARRRFGEVADEIPRGIITSAHSVMVSALANIVGFGALITTSVPAIRSLGWAVGVGVLSCAVATLFLLVPMLVVPAKREAR